MSDITTKMTLKTNCTWVDEDTIQKAVDALLKWKTSKSNSEKPQLLDQDHFVYLIITLKKIPPKGVSKPLKIPLPHPLHSPLSSELCLIFDDRPKSNLTSAAVKKKVKSENLPISKVLKLSKLASDYREFEKKRKLCASYDMFLTDKRIVPILPRLLGKHFYKKRKVPIHVNLVRKNWKNQIDNVCGSAMLYMRTGTCCVVRVARVSMEKDEIVENVAAAINGGVGLLPKKMGSVRSLHLKFLDSVALPLYQALPETKLKIDAIRDGIEGRMDNKSNEESKLEVKKDVKGKKLGKDKLKKGRIHEIHYMDP